MSEKKSVELQEFRPRDLERITAQVPAEDIAAMARDTVEDKLHLGAKVANRNVRVKQVRDALRTIKDVKGKTK